MHNYYTQIFYLAMYYIVIGENHELHVSFEVYTKFNNSYGSHLILIHENFSQ